MKHLKHINEIFGINAILNKDESTAKGILSRMDEIKDADISVIPGGFTNVDYMARYSFNIDEFNIKVFPIETFLLDLRHMNGLEYLLEIDNVKIKSSSSINRKILKKCKEIKDKRKKEDQEFIRKDAKINFSKHK